MLRDCEIFEEKLEADRNSAGALGYWGLAAAVCTGASSTRETQREFEVPSLGPGLAQMHLGPHISLELSPPPIQMEVVTPPPPSGGSKVGNSLNVERC